MLDLHLLIQEIKLVKGFTKDIKKGGQPVNLQDELLAMLSGIRIINVDVPRTMQYKITDYNRNIRSVTTAEKFFSLQNFQKEDLTCNGR